MNHKLIRGFVNYFFKGLLFLAPITITIWAILELFYWIDGLLQGFIDEFIGMHIPGLGLLILLLLITFIGFIGSTIIFKPLVIYFDKVMARAPLIKIIYTAVKDLVSAFVGQKKRFTEPVLVQLDSASNIEKLGFITNKDLSTIGISNEKVAVYLPHSYAWSGNLIIVSTKYVKPIQASSTELMKFIISAGVTNIE
ncbi:MAG: hypothetical protein C0591_08095 [Marinilabiliales bacterium]|jgi:uncharacterized membrane protein|nr:MAG: hypothetical protein C0591_08095 [Marinilabiliales bacterium]